MGVVHIVCNQYDKNYGRHPGEIFLPQGIISSLVGLIVWQLQYLNCPQSRKPPTRKKHQQKKYCTENLPSWLGPGHDLTNKDQIICLSFGNCIQNKEGANVFILKGKQLFGMDGKWAYLGFWLVAPQHDRLLPSQLCSLHLWMNTWKRSSPFYVNIVVIRGSLEKVHTSYLSFLVRHHIFWACKKYAKKCVNLQEKLPRDKTA